MGYSFELGRSAGEQQFSPRPRRAGDGDRRPMRRRFPCSGQPFSRMNEHSIARDHVAHSSALHDESTQHLGELRISLLV
jgi:hypothetical protein